MTLLPCILDKTWYFLEHLDGYARTGEVFTLDELCTNLTFDIIGNTLNPPSPNPSAGSPRQPVSGPANTCFPRCRDHGSGL